jgi:hypothetical protein
MLVGVYCDTLNLNDQHSIDDWFIPEIAKKLNVNDTHEVFSKYGVEFVGDEDGCSYIGITPDFSDDDRKIGDIKKKAWDVVKKVLRYPKEERVTFHWGTTYEW